MRFAKHYAKRRALSLLIIVLLINLSSSVTLLDLIKHNILSLVVTQDLLGSQNKLPIITPSVMLNGTSLIVDSGILPSLYWWHRHNSPQAILALQKDPKAISRALFIAQGYGRRKNYEAAFSLLKIINAANPDIADTECLRASLFKNLGEFDNAIEAYKLASSKPFFLNIACQDIYSVYVALATIHLEYRKWREAQPYCEVLLNTASHNEFAGICVGQTTFRLQPTKEGAVAAAPYFNSVLNKNPKNLEAYLRLAEMYQQVDEFDKAEGILQRGLDVFQIPHPLPRRYVPIVEHRFYILVAYGQLLFTTNRIEEAVIRLEEAVLLGNFNWRGHLWLAKAYLSTGQCTKSQEVLVEMIANWPTQQSLADNILIEIKQKIHHNECK